MARIFASLDGAAGRELGDHNASATVRIPSWGPAGHPYLPRTAGPAPGEEGGVVYFYLKLRSCLIRSESTV
jgi:hypothetical protein